MKQQGSLTVKEDSGKRLDQGSDSEEKNVDEIPKEEVMLGLQGQECTRVSSPNLLPTLVRVWRERKRVKRKKGRTEEEKIGA
jgi:hypothetical protein